MKKVLAFDLGTGSVKAALFDEDAVCLGETVVPYPLYCSPDGIFKEQNPSDWWSGVCAAAKALLKDRTDLSEITAIALSGHSLGIVPVNDRHELLCDRTPIWSDTRAGAEAADFFRRIDERTWYEDTGCGFSPASYPIFKLMWMKAHQPAVYGEAAAFIGTKDYINLLLTGRVATDISYASGTGLFSLSGGDYVQRYVEAAGLDAAKLPPIRRSRDILGTLKPELAAAWGLSPDTAVICGGVDNACMCLGAGCYENGDAYVSLGSSAWVASCAEGPVTGFQQRLYTFAHCVDGLTIPAAGIYAAGTSLEWILDTVFPALREEDAPYAAFDRLAERSPLGAHQVIFCPMLAGGSGVDASPRLRGGFSNLTLGTTREDLARATLEGVAMELSLALDALSARLPLADTLPVMGGGAKSRLWLDIYANVFGKNLRHSALARNASALGAAALAFHGAGLWRDYGKIQEAHRRQAAVTAVDADKQALYQQVKQQFNRICRQQAGIVTEPPAAPASNI